MTVLDPNASGKSQLVASTFLAHVGDEGCNGVAVFSGTVTVTGTTNSFLFPTTAGAHDTSYNGSHDAFVARFDLDLEERLYVTFLGGAAQDVGLWVAPDTTGSAVVGGFTLSTDFPTTAGAFEESFNGVADAFATRLDFLPTGADPYGASTPGCQGPIAISVDSMPESGNLGFELLCLNAPPNGVGFLGLSQAALDPPVPMFGADVWIDPGLLLLQVDATSDELGYSSVEVPIPAFVAPGTKGYAQFLWLPSPCGPQGVSTSNALELTIQ